jgi:methionyl aminopeptidase
VGDIANAIQEYTEKTHGFGVVRELVGHGLGRSLHEEPQVPNYGKKGTGAKLKEGMVLAIEPMINLGVKDIFNDDDGWTIRTKDKKVSAHFEHDVAVQRGAADILSSFEEIEEAEKANSNLSWSY